ncbi:MAG: hypothetical protein JNM00_05535 [Flavobacteriales bacterium]|nr:hypothetical protein [Flavobacteriales bacterium]
MVRKCRECGEVLKGRSDKKFCDDQCRSAYNNRINSATTSEIRNITNALRRNRRILHELCADRGLNRIPKSTLLESGFDFSFHTHIHPHVKGNPCRWCFDYGYLEAREDEVLLVKKEDFKAAVS